MKKTIIIADDHPVFIIGLKTLINTKFEKLFSIIAEANSAKELVALVDQNHPDVLLTDYNMPDQEQSDGLELIKTLRNKYPKIAIIVVTMLTNPGLINFLFEAGVYAIINKQSIIDELSQCLENLSVDKQSNAKSDKLILSPRENEVLTLLSQGKTVNEIATILNLSKQTISTHKKKAMNKIGIEKNSDFLEYLHNVKL